MKIQVKDMLTKSRNPSEYELRIENKKGDIVDNLNDGYYLIEFRDLLLKKIVKFDRKKSIKLVHLQWYVHENDFLISNITSVS